jgi:Holliday junction resolvasome RuvABC endonuclease subunit
MDNMKTLGIDPSLRAYGWAIHDNLATGVKRRIASGHEATLPSTVPVARFMHFQALIERLIDEYHPDAVGIESPAYSAGPFQTIHFGLMMFSLVPVFKKRIDCVLFDPSTLKSLAKESPDKKGQMSKLDMQRKVQIDTLDPKVIDNNEADAYLVAKYASRMISLVKEDIKPEDLTPNELKTFLLKTRKVKTLTGTKVKRMAHVFRENSRFYEFSRVPPGSVSLPSKSSISPNILNFLEGLEEE